MLYPESIAQRDAVIICRLVKHEFKCQNGLQARMHSRAYTMHTRVQSARQTRNVQAKSKIFLNLSEITCLTNNVLNTGHLVVRIQSFFSVISKSSNSPLLLKRNVVE